jgi:hypothetical protein
MEKITKNDSVDYCKSGYSTRNLQTFLNVIFVISYSENHREKISPISDGYQSKIKRITQKRNLSTCNRFNFCAFKVNLRVCFSRWEGVPTKFPIKLGNLNINLNLKDSGQNASGIGHRLALAGLHFKRVTTFFHEGSSFMGVGSS